MRGKRKNKSESQPRLINTAAYQKACFIALDGNDCIYLSLSDKASKTTTHGKQECKYANRPSNTRNAKQWVQFHFGTTHARHSRSCCFSIITHCLLARSSSEQSISWSTTSTASLLNIKRKYFWYFWYCCVWSQVHFSFRRCHFMQLS